MDKPTYENPVLVKIPWEDFKRLAFERFAQMMKVKPETAVFFKLNTYENSSPIIEIPNYVEVEADLGLELPQ